MITHKRIGILAAVLMAAVVLLLGIGYCNPSIWGDFIGASAPPYVAVMDKTEILDIQIVADEAAWADMLANAMAEEYITATVVINGKKVENVGIRPKGNSSLGQVAQSSDSDRYSFKIEFDHYVKGQTWLGLDKLVVNNMQGDSTYMKEYLSYDIMAYIGVGTPLYAFSDISVNGEAWGFYLAVEALEDSYAKRVYGNDHGKLYKPENMGMGGVRIEIQRPEMVEDMPENGAVNLDPQRQENVEDIPVGQMQSQFLSVVLPVETGETMLQGEEVQEQPSVDESMQEQPPVEQPSAEVSMQESPPADLPIQEQPQGDMSIRGELPEGGARGQRPEGEGQPRGGMPMQGEPQGDPARGRMPEDAVMQGQPPEDAAVSGEPQGDMPTQGQMPEGAFGGRDEGDGDRQRGGFGGGGFTDFGGATLQYTDDEFESYSVIFDGAVFDVSDSDRRSLISALKKLNAGEDLENAVDVEATLRYFAAHTVIVNLDSYVSGMCHNYYLYEKDGQLTMLPWDFNLAFGGFQFGDAFSIVNFPIDTPVSGVSLEDRPILAKLLEVPEYMDLYHRYLQEIVDGYFNNGIFEQTIASLDTLIAPHVESDPSAFYDFAAYQSGVKALAKLGLLRAESIEGQLGGKVPATTAEQAAYPDALIDASAIDMSALGSMGGMGGAGGGGFANIQRFNREDMEKAMEIVQAAEGNELTEEQLSELEALGITAEQIAIFQNIGQGGFGGERPADAAWGMNQPQRLDGPIQNGPMPNGIPNAAASGYDSASLIFLGGCAALLIGGLLFVVFYKRRKG